LNFVRAIFGAPDAGRTAFATARQRLVEKLSGPDCNLTDARVLAAMNRVPRHEFVPEIYRPRAYHNITLPIGHEQTISQPYIVAFMSEQLRLKPSDRVLEIGTGCGYQTAVLAELVAEVYTLEIIGPLAIQAQAELRRLGYQNIQFRRGDGAAGWPEAAPFDAIIVTCAPAVVPPALPDQLGLDGRLIIPLDAGPGQELVLFHKTGHGIEGRAVMPVRFVPMTREPEPFGTV
jgi:protein-L-isoaspartate(D-aspartate) O-methyltransferase